MISDYLWGKTDMANPDSHEWNCIRRHLIDAADIAQYKLWYSLPDNITRNIVNAFNGNMNAAVSCVSFLAGVHDVGKATPVFQQQADNQYYDFLIRNMNSIGFMFMIPSDIRASSSLRHEKSSFIAVRDWLKAHGFGIKNSPELASTVLGHHGWFDNINPYDAQSEEYGDGIWNDARIELINYMAEHTGFNSIIPNIRTIKFDNDALMLIAGIIIQADWIASNNKAFPLSLTGNIDLTEQQEHDRLETGLNIINYPDKWYAPSSHNNMLESRFGINGKINDMQREMVNITYNVVNPPLIICEAEPGSGKTEAALMAAEILSDRFHMNGVSFALPTQATTNAIFNRMEPWFDSIHTDNVILQHSNAFMNKDWMQWKHNHHADWMRNGKQSVLTPFYVSTIDQFLMMALKSKHVQLRHAGFAGKVVILDEIHACDSFMKDFLMSALEWCHAYGIPVIVLTATLDAETRNRIIQTYDGNAINVNSYPSITYIDGNKTFNVPVKSATHKTIHIDKVSGDDLINDVIESIHNGGNAAIIVNTVNKAQELYDKMCKAYPDMYIQLFHSRFTIQDRANIEYDIINKYGKDDSNRPERSVVISTQVIEQSLDLDFDIMYTDVAPIDLIIQRSGRLHRHNHIRPVNLIKPTLKIIDMPDPMSNDKPHFNGDKVYGRYRLMKAVESLQSNEFTVPDDIIVMMHKAYDGKMSELDSVSAKKWRETMKESYSDYEKSLKNKSSFILDGPMKNSALTSITEKNTGESDYDNGRTAVRSGISSINVIAMRQNDDGSFSPIYDGCNKHVFITDDMSFNDEMILYKSRVSLPFECSIHGDEIMRQLDKINSSIPEWDETQILSNEFAMIFNNNGYAEIRINGATRRLKYDCSNGLNMLSLKL